MPTARANGILIEYEGFGDRSSPALLLIAGLSGQMILWDEEFCRQLAENGLYVVRFDNRDVGLSSKLKDLGEPDLNAVFAAAWRGEDIDAPYTLEDMGDDAIGLMDALGIERAHVCGASMGGMIAQSMAIRHPSRMLSMISIASTTGNPQIAPQRPEPITSPPVSPASVPRERGANIEYTVKGMRELAGPGFAFDEEGARTVAAALYDRCFYPPGTARQLLAVLTSGNRRPALASVTVPTLVIHGDSDPLVPLDGGRDTADAVPGAELVIIEGMGHELPRGAWPRIVAALVSHARKAYPAAAPSPDYS